MKRIKLSIWAWPALLLSVFIFVFGLFSYPPLAGAAEKAQITVESVTVHPEEETTVAVSIAGVPEPGLAAIQGRISYNPAVMEVEDLVFNESFNIAVKNIQNQTGSVRFAAALSADREPLFEGEIFHLQVKAVGQPGDSTPITLEIDVLSDLDYNPIAFEVQTGSLTIKAVNRPPVADFTFTPTEPTTEDLIAFTDRSRDLDGELVSWHWDFGDGSTSEEQNPKHKYAEPGTYTVTLTVTDNEGATATKSVELFVAPMVTEIVVICYPNPASDWVTFRYYLPRGTKEATLHIFDLLGVPVFSQELDVSAIEFRWDLKDNQGRPLPNGLYFFYISGIDRDNRPIRSKIDKLVIQR